MMIEKITINEKMTKEQAILYYLFIDDQLLCAWWDYLEYWEEYKHIDANLHNNPEFVRKMEETMKAVEYWEDILDQLKNIINFTDIEEYILLNPHIKKSFLFIRG